MEALAPLTDHEDRLADALEMKIREWALKRRTEAGGYTLPFFARGGSPILTFVMERLKKEFPKIHSGEEMGAWMLYLS